jgi:S-adenosylmethionine/arginine decarboxylase-like enzyme
MDTVVILAEVCYVCMSHHAGHTWPDTVECHFDVLISVRSGMLMKKAKGMAEFVDEIPYFTFVLNGTNEDLLFPA